MFCTELSHVVQVRAEGPKAPSPGHRPGYNGNQQGGKSRFYYFLTKNIYVLYKKINAAVPLPKVCQALF